MTKGSIGLNAGAIWNLLSDGQHWSFEALRAKSALTDADLWSAIGWLAPYLLSGYQLLFLNDIYDISLRRISLSSQ